MGIRLRSKTSVFRRAVTWICPQVSVLWTHMKLKIQMKRDFSVEHWKDVGCRSSVALASDDSFPSGTEALRLQMLWPHLGGFRTPEHSSCGGRGGTW